MQRLDTEIQHAIRLHVVLLASKSTDKECERNKKKQTSASSVRRRCKPMKEQTSHHRSQKREKRERAHETTERQREKAEMERERKKEKERKSQRKSTIRG